MVRGVKSGGSVGPTLRFSAATGDRSPAMATKKRPRRPAKRRPVPRRPARRQPESLRLRSLAVSLTVNDLARSLAWDRDVLSFKVVDRWQDSGQLRGVQLKAAGCDLMFNQDDTAKART